MGKSRCLSEEKELEEAYLWSSKEDLFIERERERFVERMGLEVLMRHREFYGIKIIQGREKGAYSLEARWACRRAEDNMSVAEEPGSFWEQRGGAKPGQGWW